MIFLLSLPHSIYHTIFNSINHMFFIHWTFKRAFKPEDHWSCKSTPEILDNYIPINLFDYKGLIYVYVYSPRTESGFPLGVNFFFKFINIMCISHSLQCHFNGFLHMCAVKSVKVLTLSIINIIIIIIINAHVVVL